MKAHEKVIVDFDKSYGAYYERNGRCIEDIKFAFLPGHQWSGSDLEQFKNKPKPEDNKLFKNIMSLVGRFQEAEFGAKISSASEEATEKDASLLQAMWRNDVNSSDGAEAINNAAEEAFFGGFGAFKVKAKYDDEENPDPDKQNLCIEAIRSAPSSVFYNVGAIRKDKRDAVQAWHVERVNREETEKEFDTKITSFQSTDFSTLFDWDCDEYDPGRDIYIAHYYEVSKKRITEYRFPDGRLFIRDGRKYVDEFGTKIDKEDFEELIDAYGEESIEKVDKRIKVVEYALMSGDKYLIKPIITPFKTIPIIPVYGYHREINGIEYYCGEVCRQKDNQRFLNMGFGALMEIVSQPQTTKPEYAPEQMQRHAQARANSNIENRPFELADPIRDANGNPVHYGPTALHQPPQVGSGLATALQFLAGNIQQQSGEGQATLPAGSSAEAIRQVNERTDDAFLPLFTNASDSIRNACYVWIPAAQKLYFSNPRSIRTMREDGGYAIVETLQYGVDPKTQVYGPNVNSARGRYDVSVKQGESYKTKKDAERQSAIELLQYASTDTPIGQMALMTAIQSTTGEGTQAMRKIARMNEIQILVSQSLQFLMAGYPIENLGITEPEDVQMAMMIAQQMIQSQQQAQQDPAMIAAVAQDKIANAELLDKQVDQFNAETKRLEAVTKAQKAGFDIAKIQAETAGKQIDNAKQMFTQIQ